MSGHSIAFLQSYDDFDDGSGSDSDLDGDQAPLGETLFGQDTYNVGGNDIDEVRQKLAMGVQPSAGAVLYACYMGKSDVLHELLAAGASPDTRKDTASLDAHGVDWHESTFEESQEIVQDRREWYALQFVALTPYWDASTADCERVIEELISFGVDIYKTFRQPLWHTLPFPFPGEGHGPMFDVDAWNKSLIKAGQESVLQKYTEEPSSRKPIAVAGYIQRCLIHSLFEDGGIVTPFLEANRLNVEHRDPLGRTIVHAACRSGLGADAPISSNSTYVDSSRFANLLLPSETEPSIFDTIRLLGADLLAVDNSGCTILHHLLEARSLSDAATRMLRIRRTLKYILHHLSQLTNQPNTHGTFPIHSALQRLNYYKAEELKSMPESPEDLISDLLDGGADESVCDGRGNTALHYLAECGIFEPWMGRKVRTLAARVCASRRLDVNARNTHGRSALEIMFTVDDQLRKHRLRTNYCATRTEPDQLQEDIDLEVLKMLDDAGADWKAVTSDGKTFMHLLATQRVNHSRLKLDFLLDKGIDLQIVDQQSMTAEMLARKTSQWAFLEWLDKVKR